MTRSHKRNNHIYLVKNLNAKDGEYWYGIFIALRADDALRYALRLPWGAELLPWSSSLYKSFDVRDAGMTKKSAVVEPVAMYIKQPGTMSEVYRMIFDEIQKILYVPSNRQKKPKTSEPLPDQINLFEM